MTDTQHDDTTHPDLRLLAERYELEGELGRGGMAIVYLGRDRVTGRRVAIKVVGGRHPADSEVVRRFAREAYTVAALDHPNIVRTLAIEELGGHGIAIVSAYVEGDTLRSALRQTGRFRVDRAVEVLRDVAAGLAHAHAHRIVHRDVKPENVFLDAVTGRALLGDFGIARPLDADAYLTDVGGAVGTPTYMSPEQVDGRQVDERSDVYSLGLVGWEMLTGQQPWQGGTIYAVLYKQKHEELPSIAELRPDTPAFLYHAIEGALAKDPARRWRNAAELLARLTRPPSRVVPAVAASAPAPAPPVVSDEARAARRADGAGAVAAVRATSAPPAADEIDAAGLGLGSPFRPQSWGQAFAVVAGLVGLAAFLFRSAGEFERPVVRMDSALAAERAAATPADPGPVAPAVTRQTEAGGVAATPVATASAGDTAP
ncbi:MAG TPA: serine/threonine-protein kinase, partial [Gemmatimonadaceae bacterium]|nr:serine/threonine-protein kinase [Gemmatimonadaceae bacterium]